MDLGTGDECARVLLEAASAATGAAPASTGVVRVVGDLDIASAAAAGAAIIAAAVDAVRRVTVDLSGVSFMDCAGLGALITAQARLRDRGDRLVLQGLPCGVRRLLELTGLTELAETLSVPVERSSGSGA